LSVKKKNLHPASKSASLKQLNPWAVEVGIYLVALPKETEGRESELDEMWSYVGKKDNPRWL
jgi:insertion element IS1 protein InsB